MAGIFVGALVSVSVFIVVPTLVVLMRCTARVTRLKALCAALLLVALTASCPVIMTFRSDLVVSLAAGMAAERLEMERARFIPLSLCGVYTGSGVGPSLELVRVMPCVSC